MRPLRGSALVDDYLAASPKLAPFFFGHPSDPSAYRRKAEEVRGRFEASDRAGLRDAIRATSAAAADRRDAILSGDGFFVTTGQQAGLFGGPLYTTYKMLSAVAVARALETLLDTTVAPLFWVASDDHDWHEAHRIHLLDPSNELHEVALPGSSEPPVSMGTRTLGTGVEHALDELTQLIPPTEFRDDLIEQLRDAYQPGDTVADAFADTMAALGEPFDLLLVDPQHAVIRERSAPVIRRELEAWREHESLLRHQTARLDAAGYPSQISLIEGAANVFFEDDQGRHRLTWDEDAWQPRGSDRRFGAAELLERTEAEPERFSANVALRPVLESALLPTLAYVAGPGELRYFAQLGCLFRAHGVEMPVVVPRASVTLIEGKVEKVLEKFDLDIGAFDRPIHELTSRVVEEEMPDAVATALSALRRSIQEGYQALFEAAGPIDRTLEGPIFGARNTSFQELAEAEKKIEQHLKQQNEIGLEQLEKAAINLQPDGQPQERVLNPYQYLARYGRALLPAVLDRIEVALEGEVEGWSGVACE